MRAQTMTTKLSFFCVVLAFTVILLGAYTRLKDAGLGCPDWPGCYGQLNAPSTHEEIAVANAAYPNMPVEVSKARTEMTHRYFASSLGSLIFILGFLTLFKRKDLQPPVWLALSLMALVVFQGLLGMWTVTLRLLPVVVMAHLLGGFATLSLLWLYWLNTKSSLNRIHVTPALQILSALTLLALLGQIFLGGWTSANYAALICPDFPTCQNQWWPATQFAKAFNLLGGVGLENPLNYMDGLDRTTIHVTHRLGALIMFGLGTLLAYQLWQAGNRRLTLALAAILGLQLALGIANVVMHLPLYIAVAHNGVAALLLLVLITINFMLYQAKRREAA